MGVESIRPVRGLQQWTPSPSTVSIPRCGSLPVAGMAAVAGYDDKASSSPGNETPEKAIDGDTKTKYLNFGSTNSGLVITLPKPVIIGSLALTSANDSEERDPAELLPDTFEL